MSLRMYNATTVIPKYCNGQWKWNKQTESFQFEQTTQPSLEAEAALKAPHIKYGIKFIDFMNEINENIFQQIFRRKGGKDLDVITIQDVKDVALFMAPPNAISKITIEFFHTEIFDRFTNYLIIYFEYFLKVVEFLLIRRDDVKIKVRDTKSIKIELMISEYLAQYRLLLAREYSRILLGEKDAKPFHHIANKLKQSNSVRDSEFYETFLPFCTRVVWIAMHRTNYSIIDCEINRLFRSGHFNMGEKQGRTFQKYTSREEQVLYGPNDFRCNYQNQKSPLILEILGIKPKNTELLWIGEHKYRGTNPRIFDLELECVTHDAQLNFIDCHHGILGKPKNLYNSMLVIDWYAVRKEKYNETYDPYHLYRRPCIDIPEWEEFKKQYPENEPYFKLLNRSYNPKIAKQKKRIWKRKEMIFNSTEIIQKLQSENILKRCAREIENMHREVVIDREKIITTFLAEKEAKLKKKQNYGKH